MTNSLYEKYAPYIQEQLPDVNVEFIVGQNDLDFYEFMDENNALPDIITCCRFSLHDAAQLKGSLIDLSTSEEAGAIYDTYLKNFKNEDGSVNWLPICGDSQGFIINKVICDENNIPIPTDYDSFINACKEFEKLGIRGYVGDYYYDYNCLLFSKACQFPNLSLLKDVSGVQFMKTLQAMLMSDLMIPYGLLYLRIWKNSSKIQTYSPM